MMYGYGDADQPLPESVDLVEVWNLFLRSSGGRISAFGQIQLGKRFRAELQQQLLKRLHTREVFEDANDDALG